MCHAKTTKGTLSLSSVDEILSPFFERQLPTAAAAVKAAAATAEGEESTSPPPDSTGGRDRHRKAMPSPRGDSGETNGAGAAAAEEEQERDKARVRKVEEDRCKAAQGAREESPPPGASPRPPGGNTRPRKKIRFTGELGAFLDGEGVWGDLKEMEAERHAAGGDVPPQHQTRNDQIHRGRDQQPPDGGRDETGRTDEGTEENKGGVVEREEEEGCGETGGSGGDETSSGEPVVGWRPVGDDRKIKSAACPVVDADPRGLPVSCDPASKSAGQEDAESPPLKSLQHEHEQQQQQPSRG